MGTMFFLCSYTGDRHVEDIRGRSGSAGVDRAVRRDDRGLGTADSPALRRRRALYPVGQARWGKAGRGL